MHKFSALRSYIPKLIGLIIFTYITIFFLETTTSTIYISSSSENFLESSQTPQIKDYLVTKVIDGDTIEIEGGQKIRYIGIDTPETVNPASPVECFGKDASNKNKELVEGKRITLEKDVSETDRFGRLLRYVWVNGVFVNDYLVKEGYANASSYPPDVKYQDLFRASESEARNANKGLWGACTTTKPVLDPRLITPVITAPNKVQASCKYSCSGPDRDCSDFSTQNQAQTFFTCCGFSVTNDPMKLDGTGVDDGIACESLP